MPARPKQGCGHQRATHSSSLGPRGDCQTLEISDPEANPGDGKASETFPVGNFVDDVPGSCFEALPQARPTHPPSGRESFPIEKVQVFGPGGFLDLDLRPGEAAQVVLEEQQGLGHLITRLLPESRAVGKDGGGKDRLCPLAYDRGDVGEKLGAAAFESDGGRRHIVVPGSSKSPAPTVSQQYRLWPGSLGPYSI